MTEYHRQCEQRWKASKCTRIKARLKAYSTTVAVPQFFWLKFAHWKIKMDLLRLRLLAHWEMQNCYTLIFNRDMAF